MQKQRSSFVSKTEAGDRSAKYDYCMVFKLIEASPKSGIYSQSDESRFIIQRMREKGLDVFCYTSVQNDELIALITAPADILKKFADAIDYKMELDPDVVQRLLQAGQTDAENVNYVIKPVYINEDAKYSSYRPFDKIFGKYDEDVDQALYRAYETSPADGLFSKYYRMKLIYYILKGPPNKGGCDLEINQLVFRKKIEAFYPLHDRNKAVDIQQSNKSFAQTPWDEQLSRTLRFYFGEKIALYFAFMGHYSYWLIWPGLIGLIFQIVVFSTGNYSSPVLPFYSLVITVWAIIMLEFWKRKEQLKSLDWGMTTFEDNEPDRPEFKGNLIRSYIDGDETLYFPPDEFFNRFASSQGVIASFILAVIGVVASIYVLRFSLQSDIGSSASTVASILNTIEITILNMIYQFVATALTDSENHRTDTQYEDNLITKVFMFQFLNSYASFFFLAFIAEWLPKPDGVPDNFIGQCGAVNCMEPLAINLAIIFGTRLVVKNVMDIGMPYYKAQVKYKAETQDMDPSKQLTPPEQDYMLMQYDVLVESIGNYADAAIQFGYSSLFVTALPMAPFFSFLSNIIRNKLNIYKLTTLYQRPIPAGAQDIGSWMGIFQVISVLSVVTNAGIICFTMNVLDGNASPSGRVWVFVGFILVLVAIQFIVQTIIPDVPEEVEIQTQRMDFIVSKLILKTPDEEPTPVAGFPRGPQDPDLNDGTSNAPTGFFVRVCELLQGVKGEDAKGNQLKEFNAKMRAATLRDIETRDYFSNGPANPTLNPMNGGRG